MRDAPPDPAELRAYAAVVASMSLGTSVDEAVAEVGLTARDYEALEQRVDAALGRAVAASGAAPDPFLVAYERALREAQVARRPPVAGMSVDALARALAALVAGGDPRRSLDDVGVDAAAVLRGLTEHAGTFARDPALANQLAQLLANPKKP